MLVDPLGSGLGEALEVDPVIGEHHLLRGYPLEQQAVVGVLADRQIEVSCGQGLGPVAPAVGVAEGVQQWQRLRYGDHQR